MYNAHSKYIGKQLGFSILFLFINVLIFYYGYFWHEIFCIIPLSTIVVQLVLVFKERKKFDYKKPIFRQILLILELIVAIFALVSLEGDIVDESRVTLVAAISASASYTNLILALLSFAFVRAYEVKKLSKRNQVDELDPKDGTSLNIQNVKKLGLGYISKKDFGITLCSHILAPLIMIAVSFLSFDDMDILEIIISFICLFIVYFMILLIRVKIISKPLRKFEDTFDYPKLEETLNKVINNPKVHDETINYYKLLLANYIGVFSLEKRKEILKDVFVPSFPAYRLNYFMVESLEFVDDKEKLYECYQKMKDDPALKAKSQQRQIDKMIRQAKIIFGDLETKNFDADFPIVYNSKLMHINNKVAKLRYYYYRNDMDNVKIMAEDINKFIADIPLYPKENLKINKYLEK